MARSISWHALCAKADPGHDRKAREVIEYRFRSPGGQSRTGSERTHQDQERVFMADYQRRGAYQED